MTTRAQVEAVFAVVDRLIASGDLDGARILTGAFGPANRSVDATQDGDEEKRAAARERKRRSREKRDMSRLSQDRSHVTNVSPRAPLSEEEEKRKPILSGQLSAESESLEKSGRERERATVTPNVTHVTHVTLPVTRDQSDASASTPHTLWRQIFEQWVFIAHNGKSIGSPSQFSQSFTDIARMAEQRCPHEPVQYATEVMRRYVLDRRQKGKAPNPRYFAADFGTFADSTPAQPGAPVLDPVVREMRELNAKYAEAQQRGDAVAEATYEQKLKLLGQRILANAS